MEQRDARTLNLPDHAAWEMSYEELVKRFIAEAPIASDDRRTRLQFDLCGNTLGLEVGSDLGDVGKLTAGCKRLMPKQADTWVVERVQKPLEQLSRWAASIGLLPYDPLSAWRRMRRQSAVQRRSAYMPEEIRFLFESARELDLTFNRKHESAIIYMILLLNGNRPSVIFRAKVGDLNHEQSRIVLPEGQGNKRNGMAHLPHAFMPELRKYLVLCHS